MVSRDDDRNEDTPAGRDSESTNRKAWTDAGQIARFASAAGFIDRSERAILERLTAEFGGGEVLDIGVGGGRTVPLLAPTAGRYVAVDFVPQLVAAARQRFPGADIRIGDARALDFPDASFDLVVFSINGLDAIAHADRAVALREIRRVLRPSGAFVFSTHNLDGPGPRERPWSIPPISVRQPRSSARTLLRRITKFRTSMANYRGSVALNERGPDWMVTASGAHEFGLVVHYTTASGFQGELRDAGFEGAVELWDDKEGLPSGEARPQRRWWYFNIVARCSAADSVI